MGLEAYNDFLQNFAISPKEKFWDLQQAWVDAQWDDGLESAHWNKIIEEESFRGSFEFQNIEAIVNSVSEFTINTLKNEEDFRRILFRNQAHSSERGLFYRFDNNYWMVYNETNPVEPFAEVYVRRCNNIAKWIDEDGFLHQLPCILDYDDMSPKQRENKDIITPSNSVILIVQGNEDTLKFKENQRFIFNGRPFKINGYNNYMQNNYVDMDTPMLFFDLYLDEKKSDDDVINNIANKNSLEYKIRIISEATEVLVGNIGKLNVVVERDDKVISDAEVKWTSNEFAEIDDDGNYIIVGEVGDIATITATVGDASDSIDIHIIRQSDVKKEIIINPFVKEIKQGESIIIRGDVYINNEKQISVVNGLAEGADSDKCYLFESLDDNEFKITNLIRSKAPLRIKLYSGSIEKIVEIELKSLF